MNKLKHLQKALCVTMHPAKIFFGNMVKNQAFPRHVQRKSWIVGALLGMMVSVPAYAQQAPDNTFTLTDDGANEIPTLTSYFLKTLVACREITTDGNDYESYQSANVSSSVKRMIVIAPDKSAPAKYTRDVEGQSYPAYSPVVLLIGSKAEVEPSFISCPGNGFYLNNGNVHSLIVKEEQSCDLTFLSRDGVHKVFGTLKLTTGSDSTEYSDYYYELKGTCDYDAGSANAPTVASITRKTPTTAESSDGSLTWLVQFSEDVSDVDMADFEVTGASGMTLAVTKAENYGDFGYEVTASGGDFTTVSQAAFLALKADNDIKEVNGTQQALSSTKPSVTNDNYYCYESCSGRTTTGKKTKVETSKGILTNLKEEDSSAFTTGKPDNVNFDLGTYSYKVENLTAGDTVTITLTMESDVPTDAKVYKATSSGYTELGSSNNLVINGKTIKFDITDGGALDADGDATNGVIVDPVAIGTSASTTTSSSGSGSFGIMGVLFGSVLFGLAAYRRRARMQ